MKKLSNVEMAKAMEKYLEDFRKFSKEHPADAKKVSEETLRKLGLLQERKEDKA